MIFCSPWYRPCKNGIVVRSNVLSNSSCKLFYVEYIKKNVALGSRLSIHFLE